MPRRPEKPRNIKLDRPYLEIGERIKEFRLKSGLNQSDLGPTPTITRFETGVRLPSVELLIKMRRDFGADLNWILCGDDKKF